MCLMARGVKIFSGCKVGKGFAGDFLDEETEHFEVDVAVDETGAGRVDGRLRHSHGECGVASGPGRLQIEVGREAGVVGEQFANGDVLLAVLRELGQLGGDRIVEANAALLHQLHDGRGGRDALGQRGEIEDRIDGHGLARGLERSIAERAAVDNVAVMADQEHGAGDVAVGHGLLHDGIEESAETG